MGAVLVNNLCAYAQTVIDLGQQVGMGRAGHHFTHIQDAQPGGGGGIRINEICCAVAVQVRPSGDCVRPIDRGHIRNDIFGGKGVCALVEPVPELVSFGPLHH